MPMGWAGVDRPRAEANPARRCRIINLPSVLRHVPRETKPFFPCLTSYAKVPSTASARFAHISTGKSANSDLIAAPGDQIALEAHG